MKPRYPGDGVVIPAFDYLVFFADDDGTQGALHTNYQLSESGETILLVHPDARTVIDEIEFGPQVRDVSYGRFEDGADTWGFHIEATPGLRNRPHSG